MQLTFEQGTLLLQGSAEDTERFRCFVPDPRTRQLRAPAREYREFILQCSREGVPVEDKAKAYRELQLELRKPITPRPHQKQALDKWFSAGMRGVVSLPTGAGKTILAVLGIQQIARSTLVIVPTLDLVAQWRGVLEEFFGTPIGQLGGGIKNIEDLTVATYDTARLVIESLGNRFGFLICDECHHLPAPMNQLIALAAIAPFRLGLSATVERVDGGEEIIYDLVGPLAFEGFVHEMVDDVLAPYDVINIEVDLTDAERERYQRERQTYLTFVRKNGIDFSRPDGWKNFIMRSARSPEGRAAMTAYREQKKIAQSATAKLEKVWSILCDHAHDSVIVFTDDNELAYGIGRQLVLAVLTHKTKQAERKEMLRLFREGVLKVLVTSRVLNEGVDVPCAAVGIVVSGTGTVREHVQRLGRVLRNQPGKRAVMYEIVSKDTNEIYVNKRRRQHSAYDGPP